LDTVAGVPAVGPTSRPLGLAFHIRGFGNTEQPASESRIIVTVDGISKFCEPYRRGAFFNEVALYQRVEVLRGPAALSILQPRIPQISLPQAIPAHSGSNRR
jgi:hemoglobin/transferrin/lactoferrin receptor protein